ncbi:DoxX family protein [Virgibacillus flavescens]|uniref:DoxX family protein n=1 Tax=Virgibacillus flavescens TaxID=1611422 RepID=UPI003D32CF3E
MPISNWICYAVGYVFIITGLMKLLFNDFQASFASLEVPFPATLLLVVAITEIVCGALIAGRFYVKEASLPLIVIVIAAIILTKLPLLTSDGFFHFLYAARLDIVMLILLFLLWNHVRGQKFR